MSLKSVLVILFCLISIGSVCAVQAHDGALQEEGTKLGLTLEPSIVYMIGDAKEIVYYGSSDDYLSELIWDLSNLVYTGGSVSFNISNRFYINTGIWFAINPGNGYMEDFDWLNLQGNNYTIHDEHDRAGWTNWSLSSVDVVDSLLFDFNLAFDFLKSTKYKVSVIAGLKYSHWNWSDSVLDSMYPSGPDVIEVGTNSITYQLSQVIPYFGVGFGLFLGDFILDGKIIYSPLLYAFDHDHHILTTTHYEDLLFSGQYLAFSLKSGYRFTNFFSLTCQFSMEYLFEKRGYTFAYPNGESREWDSSPSYTAGFQYQAISVSINAAFSF